MVNWFLPLAVLCSIISSDCSCACAFSAARKTVFYGWRCLRSCISWAGKWVLEVGEEDNDVGDVDIDHDDYDWLQNDNGDGNVTAFTVLLTTASVLYPQWNFFYFHFNINFWLSQYRHFLAIWVQFSFFSDSDFSNLFDVSLRCYFESRMISNYLFLSLLLSQ